MAAAPIGWLAAPARAVGVAVDSIIAGPIVAGNRSVAVGRGVRVGVTVRVGPKSGNGRTVGADAIGRGVAVGAAHADNTLAHRHTLKKIRRDLARGKRVGICKLYRRLRLFCPESAPQD